MAKKVPIKKAWKTPARTAVTLIERMEDLFSDYRRWTQNNYSKDNASFCLIGGMRYVKDGTKPHVLTETRIRLKRAIRERDRGSFYGQLETWNDAYGRKIKDIREVLAVAKTVKLNPDVDRFL